MFHFWFWSLYKYCHYNIGNGCFCSDFLSEHEEKTKAAAEVLLHGMNALFKAGPNTSHINLVEKLLQSSPSIEEHIQVVKTLSVQ